MMKKSIFAVAVASVLTLGAAHAETVLYGSIRYDYESKKIQGMEAETGDNWVDTKVKKITSNRLSNLNDAGSRIGLKGSEDLGNNNAVIYNLEWGFDGMIQDESKDSKWTTRKAILGLTGDWGTVTAGRQDNPFKVTIVDDSVTDDFNGGNVISSAAQRAMTTSLLAQGLSSGEFIKNGDKLIPVTGSFVNTVNNAKFSRVGKVIAYTTPEFAGFQANAAVMMDSDLYPTNNRKNADLWTINARYAYDLGADNQILAKVGYIQGKVAGAPTKDGKFVGKPNDNGVYPNNNGRYSSKVWGLYLGYLSDDIKVSASYADGTHKEEDANKQKAKGWDLGASYSFGPNHFSTVRAAYGQNEVKVGGEKDKMKSWAVGFEQKLSTRTRAWVEYGAEETKFHGQGSAKQKDNVVSVGMRHDF